MVFSLYENGANSMPLIWVNLNERLTMGSESIPRVSTESEFPLIDWQQQSPKSLMLQLVVLSLIITNIVTFGLWLNTLHSISSWQLRDPDNQPQTAYLGVVKAPVEYETRRFHTGMRDGDVTDFFGLAGDKTADAAWNTILDTPLTRLTAKQATQLGTETSREWNATASYVGIVGVFHQLHCLSRLRYIISHPDRFGEFEGQGIAETHKMHCIEYLRQSIMCLGDVTVEPVGFDEDTLSYIAAIEPVRQCRKFDLLYNWAKKEEHAIPGAPGNIKVAGEMLEFKKTHPITQV
ncbi:hypothetical protein F5884DRAFT_305938 [Xylogone sp. PMI_703]|nr:hypothetical protein F5884DRAFT_305938 [Xylogone sp. PMI_703]